MQKIQENTVREIDTLLIFPEYSWKMQSNVGAQYVREKYPVKYYNLLSMTCKPCDKLHILSVISMITDKSHLDSLNIQ
jgi:hypothetical protein